MIQTLLAELEARKNGTLIGLNGGIACGKSTVSKMFSDYGYHVIDFDSVTRKVRATPEISEKIRARFNTEVPDDLRKIIFADKQAEKDLAELVGTPTITDVLKETLAVFSSSEKRVVVWDSALLTRYELDQFVDLGLYISAEPEAQRHRLLLRDKITPELADQMIKNQQDWLSEIPHWWRRIDNSKDLSSLKSYIESVIVPFIQNLEKK